MIVIDASALAKVLLQEENWESVPLTEKTATLDYALVEALNAIWKAVIQKRLDEEDAKDRTEALKYLAKSLLLFEAKNYFERALEIALKEKITIYDALYIALAEELKADLYTSDVKQFEAAKKYVRTKLIQ
ncbi:type II toxin-antitoxin system VapC family toxin [Thermococcus alcaliphilus]|uniref:type II toxin-antitoxin system VapC family toxin n=1 Tax=Thermococcus alcaliphilus TaxID=139207 RepID=UPI0020919C85|nr:type II toxin-antitoxin system VapC family toxin [Thermococcus alcaliphilus]